MIFGLGLALLIILPASAFAQAAAESVLLHGGSAAATAKAGSTLGSALNQSMKQLSGRVAQTTSPQVVAHPLAVQSGSKSPVKSAAASSSTVPAQGSMIGSIQGAAPTTTCASTSQSAPANRNQTAAQPARTDCGSQLTSQKSKSVITLPF
jgi:hypothetical protein